jgi:hypothetical protein
MVKSIEDALVLLGVPEEVEAAGSSSRAGTPAACSSPA